jgi:6-phosphogluconolactonase (cycloisomerase 2 family)
VGGGACTSPSSGGNGGGGGGGGGGGTGSYVPGFLYYLDNNSNIQGASLSSAGTLAALSGYASPNIPVDTSRNMVIAQENYLYLPQKTNSLIQGFAINRTTGALTAVPGNPTVTSGGDNITRDPSGQFVFLSNSSNGFVSSFQVTSSSGALTQAPGSPFSGGLVSGYNIATDANGFYLYVGQGNPSLPVVGFTINTTSGALGYLTGSPMYINVAGVRPESTGTYMVGISGNTGDNHVYVFMIQSSLGFLTAVPNSPFATMYTPQNFAVSPAGPFVYSFGVNSSGSPAAIEGFQINLNTGALTAIPGSPFTSLQPEAECKFDQSGTELYCADPSGTSFTILDANTTTGVLTKSVQTLNVTNNYPFAVTD